MFWLKSCLSVLMFGAKRLPHQRRGRAGYLRQQIRKGEKVAGRNEVKAACPGAGTAGDWGYSERSDCLIRGAAGPGICASKYGKAKRPPDETK